MINWPPCGVSKPTFRVIALRQSEWRKCDNSGLCVGLYAENGATVTLLVGLL